MPFWLKELGRKQKVKKEHHKITIFDSYNPLVSISDFSAGDGWKGCKHGVKSLECTFIRKCNTYSIVFA